MSASYTNSVSIAHHILISNPKSLGGGFKLFDYGATGVSAIKYLIHPRRNTEANPAGLRISNRLNENQ
jgi:hypothetical protein